MNEEITDVKPPMGFPHITDLAGSEATILQVANSQGDILGYATLNDIDAYIEQKVSETVHSFSQKQIFQDVTINGTFDGNNVINPDKLNGALTNYVQKNDLFDYLLRIYIESDGTEIMHVLGSRFMDMGLTNNVNHTYLVVAVDKYDSNKKVSFIMDYVHDVTDSHIVLTQTGGLTYYASNKIGTVSLAGGSGAYLFYAVLLA